MGRTEQRDVMYIRYVTQYEADKIDVFLHNLRKEDGGEHNGKN